MPPCFLYTDQYTPNVTQDPLNDSSLDIDNASDDGLLSPAYPNKRTNVADLISGLKDDIQKEAFTMESRGSESDGDVVLVVGTTTEKEHTGQVRLYIPTSVHIYLLTYLHLPTFVPTFP